MCDVLAYIVILMILLWIRLLGTLWIVRIVVGGNLLFDVEGNDITLLGLDDIVFAGIIIVLRFGSFAVWKFWFHVVINLFRKIHVLSKHFD